jgi:hypothetical protein
VAKVSVFLSGKRRPAKTAAEASCGAVVEEKKKVAKRREEGEIYR